MECISKLLYSSWSYECTIDIYPGAQTKTELPGSTLNIKTLTGEQEPYK